MKLRTSTLIACFVVFACVTSAGAANRVVDDDGEATATNCNSGTDTPYTTVGEAIADANPGDKIIVCPGVYNEQVTVTINLTISGRGDATLKPSPMVANSSSLVSGNPIAAVILVEGAANVIVEQLTVDGDANGLVGCGGPNPIGIYYRNASGSVKNAAVKNMKLPNPAQHGCQVGLGIFAQTSVGNLSNLTVTGTSVHDYQKNGITGNEVGTTLTATNNTVTGWGATPDIAQNGIQIGFGAGGSIKDNRVADHFYSQCALITDTACDAGSSTGILVFDGADGVVVSGNTVITSQTGVYLDSDSGAASSNKISNTIVYDGIYVPGDGNSVLSNLVADSDESGIWIDGSGNIVQKNTINETPIGIVGDDPPNTITLSGSGKNVFYNVGQNVTSPAPAAISSTTAATERTPSPAQ